MIIGIISALEEEIKFIRYRMNQHKTFLVGGCKIYIGLIKNITIILVVSGVGKTLASLGTTILVNNYKPNVIINIGTAGSIISELQIGDIVIANEVSYYDVDMTAFGYKLGQVSGFPIKFTANKDLINQTEICMNQLNFRFKKGLIVSGDKFINDIKYLKFIFTNFPKAVAIEMESAAIAHICYIFQIPFIAIRSISDIVSKQSNINFKKNLINSTEKCCIAINKILTNISN
ncbi:5'-methylthioadenosine/S-adenosylhomocysteine nucleosidase [Candidatus Pantoea edessiphila]|uniref:adenosylhomocysteine nucleosidase n=1 Tax=Candidatus Pantoea edessiphila TaxID=2044610 RepID=A0A2P5T0A2_9GAMM|nr:5'-methylthioadenosine/adenosylhomocysteine nucleosidase [Candidatus Pantoea edessiphila]PPI87993.1 5'-methylthioadenosine/S-adenosylhomocysteine nucleosidase [Candidatus Pantoea edessiphila]